MAPKPQTFTVKSKGSWKLLGVTYDFKKLDRVLGMKPYQLEYMLAEAQRRPSSG